MNKYQRKNLLKSTAWRQRDQLNSAILVASFWEQFLSNQSDFWLKPTKPENFYIFWEWDEQKIYNYFWRFWYTRDTLSPGQKYFFFALNFI